MARLKGVLPAYAWFLLGCSLLSLWTYEVCHIGHHGYLWLAGFAALSVPVLFRVFRAWKNRRRCVTAVAADASPHLSHALAQYEMKSPQFRLPFEVEMAVTQRASEYWNSRAPISERSHRTARQPGSDISAMRKSQAQRDDLRIADARTAYLFLRPMACNLDREHFWRLDLDSRGRIIGHELVSIGSLTATIVHPRELFLGAILSKAVSIIVAHNHPSGDPSPSSEDIELTRGLARAGQILAIPVVDHLIIGDEEGFSFKAAGQL